MRKALLLLFFLPLLCFGQTATYFSGDGSANFGKYLSYTGYSVNLSGNIRLVEKLYGGLSTGVLKVQPFVDKLTVPLSARITFFTASDETQIAPFGLFEVGKLFYSQDNYGNTSSQTMEGRLSFFTGVGVRLTSQQRTHLFFALGYAGYDYDLVSKTGQNATASSRPYNFRRIALKIGLMLPH